jgi:hypothetical protein
MNTDLMLREQLVAALRGGSAHDSYDQAVAGWPHALQGIRPAGGHHSAWEIVEHLRIAEWDILEFSRSADHVSPGWPAGYWPDEPVPPDAGAWDRSVNQFQESAKAMEDLLMDPASDLHARIPHGDGQTLLREALTLVAHNSYHIGQLIMLKRIVKGGSDPGC